MNKLIENENIYLCIYNNVNLGVFSENDINFTNSNTNNISEFIDEYIQSGTPNIFMKQLDDITKKIIKKEIDIKELDEIERKMYCLNLIALIKKDFIKNTDDTRVLKMNLKDKKMTMNLN